MSHAHIHTLERPRSALREERAGPREAFRALAKRLLRTPLFWKLFLANAAVLLVGGGAAVLLALRTVAIGGLEPAAAVELLLVPVLVVCALANAAVIRLALSPLSALEQAARRFRGGDVHVRAPHSPVADVHLRRVVELFNQMLDWIEADRERRTELSLRVLQAEERERERLGRELYGCTAQTLAGVLVRLSVAERTGDVCSGGAALREVRGEVASALDDIRRMARRLHPPELAELGAQAALEAHGRHLAEEHGMPVRFLGTLRQAALSPDAALVLFRIVQEAVSNAVLHSGASCVQVRFETTGKGTVAEVADDGCGFDPDRRLLTGEGGLGLLGMRERAGYVSADLEVVSAPGAGTTVRLTVPGCPESPDAIPGIILRETPPNPD